VSETNDGALDLGGRHKLPLLAKMIGPIASFGHS